MTQELIKRRGRPFKEVQRRVQSITDHYRIVGHTINMDLEALKITPKNEIIDIRDLPEIKSMYSNVMDRTDICLENIGFVINYFLKNFWKWCL